MKLVTTAHTRRLLSNGRWNNEKKDLQLIPHDFRPVVKLFCPWNRASWLLTELDPGKPDIGFGLCDLGLGAPRLGRVRLSKLAALRGPGGLQVERDRSFRSVKPLSAYAAEARAHRRIMA